MLKTGAYIEWKGMFDDTVYKVWKDEPNSELRRVSMMLHVIKNEFKRITKSLENNLKDVKKKIEVSPRKSPNIRDETQFNTARTSINKENLQTHTNNNQNDTLAMDSPDMFQNENTSSDSKQNSILISDDDDFIPRIKDKFGSPEIKKGRRSHRLKTHKNVESPSALFLKNIEIKTTNPSPKDTATTAKETIISPKNTSLNVLDQNITCLSSETPIKDTEKSKIESLEFSFIPCTPTLVSKSSLSLKQNSKMGSFFSKKISSSRNIMKKKKVKNKNSTITQMFGKRDLSHLVRKDKQNQDNTDYDSDVTYFEEDTVGAEKTSDNVGLTKMLSLINRTDNPSSQNPSYDFGDIVSFQQQNMGYTQRSMNSNKETRSPQHRRNSESYLETREDSPKNLKKVNEILAEAQGVPDHQLEAEPVVRGKSRKQLPGWACKECEKFYVNQSLSDTQIIALNKCTKHRGYYRPREDTLPGFWDLSMPTQEKEQK